MRLRSVGSVLGAAALVVAGISAAPAGADSSGRSPGTRTAGGELGVPNPDIVETAREHMLVTHDTGGTGTNMGNTGGGPVIMAFAALAGDTSVDQRLLEQIRHTLTGGNDIGARGAYPAQHELQVTSMFAIVKNITRIWDPLTADERERADAMMKASLIGGAFTTSDSNPYIRAGEQQRDMRGGTNLGRTWNPNFREGMYGSVIVAAAYFGIDEAKAFMETYDHESFAAHLCDVGLDNSCEVFNFRADNPDSLAPTGQQVESAIHDWSAWGVPVGDVMTLAADLAYVTFARDVECGLNGGAGIPAANAPNGIAGVIHAGCDELPNLGQPGMLLEFDSVDGGGPRSGIGYAFDGLKPSLFVRGAMIVNGLWEPGPVADEIAALTAVGAEDVFYKLENGYRNYQSGNASSNPTTFASRIPQHAYVRSLWEEVIAAYHGITPSPTYVLNMFDRYLAGADAPGNAPVHPPQRDRVKRIQGAGPGASGDHRAAAFRNMLEEAATLVERGDDEGAVAQLGDARQRIHVDGDLRPSHLITGEHADVMHRLIERLEEAIEQR